MNDKISVWDNLPQWHKWVQENEIKDDTSPVKDALRIMCDCVGKRHIRNRCGQVCELLSSWYMPRNERDVQCYVMRYRVFDRMMQVVSELLFKNHV